MPKHNHNVPKLDIKPELLDEWLKTSGDINTLFKGLKKAILERALGKHWAQSPCPVLFGFAAHT